MSVMVDCTIPEFTRLVQIASERMVEIHLDKDLNCGIVGHYPDPDRCNHPDCKLIRDIRNKNERITS